MSRAIRNMTSGKTWYQTWAVVLAVVVALASTPALNRAQSQSSSGASSTSKQIQDQLASQDITFRNPYGGTDPMEAINRERRLKAMNAQRQKTMVEDTNKLVQLTTQLNTEVANGHAQTLNADQLRRLAEIEKLAKNVREKMSDAVGPTPEVPMPDGRTGRFPAN